MSAQKFNSGACHGAATAAGIGARVLKGRSPLLAAAVAAPCHPLFLASFLCLLSFAGIAWVEEVSTLQADFLQGRYEKVLEGTQRSLRSSSHSHADELLFLQGASALKMHRLDLAGESFRQLLSQYPDSPWIPEAKILMGRLSELQKPAEPVAPAAAALSVPDDSFFAVQVGAFASEKNALKLKTELERRNYPSSITPNSDSSGTLYKVRVGHYDKRQEAEQQADKLRSEGFPAKVVP